MPSNNRTRRNTWRAAALASAFAVGAALIACGGFDDAKDLSASAGGEASAGSAVTRNLQAELDARAVDGAFAFPQSAPAVAEPPPGQAGGGGGFDLLGRSIIRTGSVDLEVESVAASFERVSAIATGAGGFVADSSFFGREEEQTAQLTVRVPAERFEHVVEQLRELAIEVRSISTSAQDVTGEVTDLESTLRNLRAVEAQYLELLGRANAIGDVLQVQDRLNETRAQIERTQGRIQLLGRLSDLATLSVSLRPESAPPIVESGGGPLEAAREAWDASLATLSAIATAGIVVVVYSWWLLPVALVLALLARRAYRAWGERSRALAVRSIDTPQGTA